MQNTFITPVLLILFNRPEETKKLIYALSKIKPEKIYISADGPRKNFPNDEKLCKLVREISIKLDWECDVHTRFLDNNLGVDKGMESAISWFFEHEEEGIICEDDCIPTKSFFIFSEVLLNKYRNDKKIMLISGTNFENNISNNKDSYYFSNYPTWGWAMWKRTWDQYDTNLENLENFISKKRIEKITDDKVQQKYWIKFFKKIKNGKFTFCDAKLIYSIWNAGGICITPTVNLVKNIGFGIDATHTIDNATLSVDTQELKNIIHPINITINREADKHLFNIKYKTTFISKALYKLKLFKRNIKLKF